MKDLVNHPAHYKSNKFESIEIIEDFELNFCLGNAVKYILRCEKKGNKKQDIEKAIWYLKREVEKMSVEGDKCSEQTLDCQCKDLPDRMIEVVVRLGRAQQFLKNIVEDKLFDNLSKHDPKWRSEHDEEDEVLDATRRSLSCLSDNLWSLMSILRLEDN